MFFEFHIAIITSMCQTIYHALLYAMSYTAIMEKFQVTNIEVTLTLVQPKCLPALDSYQ